MKSKQEILQDVINHIKSAINGLDVLDKGCNYDDFKYYSNLLKIVVLTEDEEGGLTSLLEIIKKQ